MRKVTLLVTAALVVALFLPGTAVGAGIGAGHRKGPPPLPAHAQHRVCGPPAAGTAACHAHEVTKADRTTPLATTGYQYGYAPADLQSAYNLAPTGAPGTGPTVAIVDAYDNPNVESDLATYRSQFGLGDCTTANGCFKKVNQSGAASPLPRGNTGWGQEINLDVQMVSAVCPECKILLVEARSNSFGNLMAAVDYATANADVVSNSYGGSEFSSESSYESHFNHPGVAITVSSGDAGYGVEYPAASRYVTAVGGTSLSTSTDARGWSESAWSGAGSGCSTIISKPTWQADTGCAGRTVADVSAVADPNTGVAVYDTYGSHSGLNWYVFGGTSVAAPVVAGVYALSGAFGSGDYPSSYAYAAKASLYDVTSGSNGSCGGSYLCTGGVGFDGPTGLGTPNGSTAFGLPTLKPGGAAVLEGNSGTRIVNVPIRLSYPAPEPVTVDWHTLDTGAPGVATAGVDYVAASGTVTFAPGETTKTVPITVYGDTIYETPLLWGEWILVPFTNPSANAKLDTSFFGLGIGVIIDDDPAP